jgi:hypothetical protein
MGWQFPADYLALAVAERNRDHPKRGNTAPELFYRLVNTFADNPCVIPNKKRGGLVRPCVSHEIEVVIHGFQFSQVLQLPEAVCRYIGFCGFGYCNGTTCVQFYFSLLAKMNIEFFL